jgi:hypothetical protein
MGPLPETGPQVKTEEFKGDIPEEGLASKKIFGPATTSTLQLPLKPADVTVTVLSPLVL